MTTPRPSTNRPISSTRVIALMNQKGGVGKTTTTVNLAAAWAKAGRETLVIDLDPQAHATLHLGVDPASVQRSIYDLLIGDEPDIASIATSTRDHLWVLPAHTDLAAAESELARLPDRQKRLDAAIARAAGRYEFILIDCPPSLGLLTLNALAAAREVIIPMQAHFLALQGVGKLLETVNLVSRAVNPRLRVTGVVLTAHDTSSTHTREVVADLESFFESARPQESPWRFARVLRPAIRRNIKLAECPSFGQTIFEYAPQASGAEDYAALGASLLKEWDAMLAKAKKSDAAPSPSFAPALSEVHVVARQPAPEATA